MNSEFISKTLFSSRRQKVILLVEDDDHDKEHSEKLLISLGYFVYSVSSGEEAIEILKSKSINPDVVITDLCLLGSITGLMLALKIRNEHPNLPVVIYTGTNPAVLSALEHNFIILPKPLNMDIIQSVSNQFGKKYQQAIYA